MRNLSTPLLPLVASALLASTLTTTARADTVYNISLTGLTQNGFGAVGSAGSAVGTITTDGTIGALDQSDILDWLITVSNGVDTPLVLAGPSSGNNSSVGVGSGLSASAAQITFNFSGSDEFYFEGGGGAVSPGAVGFLCLGPSSGDCAYPAVGQVIGIDDGPSYFAPGDERDSPEAGSLVIGAIPTSTTPEPSSYALLAVGMASLLRLRRQQSA